MASPGRSVRWGSCLVADSSSIVTVASRGEATSKRTVSSFLPQHPREDCSRVRACYLLRKVLVPGPRVGGWRAGGRSDAGGCPTVIPRGGVRIPCRALPDRSSGRLLWCVSPPDLRASVGPPGGSGCLDAVPFPPQLHRVACLLKWIVFSPTRTPRALPVLTLLLLLSAMASVLLVSKLTASASAHSWAAVAASSSRPGIGRPVRLLGCQRRDAVCRAIPGRTAGFRAGKGTDGYPIRPGKD